jgi:hypothetical protein
VLSQVRDPQYRQQGEQAIARIEMQVGPRLASNVVPAPQGAPAQALPQPAPVDPGVLANPDEEYTKEVKNTLVEAMLEYSSNLAIGPDEHLTIAARNGRPDRLAAPSDPSDAQTILFSIKGSDLAAFHEGRLTLDDARKKVQITQD